MRRTGRAYICWREGMLVVGIWNLDGHVCLLISIAWCPSLLSASLVIPRRRIKKRASRVNDTSLSLFLFLSATGPLLLLLSFRKPPPRRRRRLNEIPAVLAAADNWFCHISLTKRPRRIFGQQQQQLCWGKGANHLKPAGSCQASRSPHTNRKTPLGAIHQNKLFL